MFGAVRGKRHVVSAIAFLAVASVLANRSEAGGRGARFTPSDAGAETMVAGIGTDLSEATGAPVGKVRVMVELVEPAGAVAYGNALRANAGLPKMQARNAAASAGRAQLTVVRSAQARFESALARLSVRPTELFRVQKSLNGFALEVGLSQMAELRSLPGVKQVIPLYLEHTTNSTSVPFIGTPNVWANNGLGLPAGALGTGIRVGIIDTGIDYLHPDFGGPGATAADYTTERTDTATFTTVGTVTGGSFPTAKVVGGTDFAGDAYTGANVPVPDANPMDCNGHGSHVSGTAAGYGMKADGTTFAGPYDADPSTYSSLLIGPGTAPQAQLYALRVFGCTGSTGLTTQAIDWAVDPNDDGDLSDHLDVINMSLGSSFGSAVTASAVSSDNAAFAGVVVVSSAGNAGDTFFITGAPGTGSRVISTAASVDSGVTIPVVNVNTPAGIAGGYPAGSAAFGPALTAAGVTGNVVVGLDPADAAGPLTTDACSALTNAAAVAGNIALVDRGTCAFTVKVKNAQNAGAIGVMIANNTWASAPPGFAGVDATITIPSVGITQADGATFKANIASLNVTLRGDIGSDTVASFSSRGPRRIFGSPLRLKPDIAAPGLNITSVETGIVCTSATGCTGVADPSGIQVGTRTLTISGTSMASPHMAGVMALLRELHPDWEVEELKALAMNYANHDTATYAGGSTRYGPSRIGGGRVDPALSATGSVIAMNAEDAGLVSVTFFPEVAGVTTQLKKVRVVNKGTTSQTYALSFDLTNAPPGVSFSTPGGSSVTVPAGGAVELDVQLSANSALMDEKRDPALAAKQGVQANYGDQPRHFLTEAEGYLTFKQGGSLKLRLPVYMAEKPSSQMSAPATIATGGAPTGSTTIPLSGVDLCTGTLVAGPGCSGTFPTDIESLVTPFELQVVSPLDPVNSTDYADLQYAGVAYYQAGGTPSLTNDLVLFGLSTWGDWSTPNDVALNVCVDFNNDGVYDRAVINTQPSIFVSGASQTDTFVRVIQNLSTGGYTILGLGSPVNLIGPDAVDTSLHLNNVLFLGATPSQLGFTSTASLAFRYKIVTCPGSNPGCARSTTGDHCTPPGSYYDVAPGPYPWNPAAQGLNFGGNFLDDDLNGATLPVTWNTASMAANGSQGALLLHHHNRSGQRAEVVLLDTGTSADLAVTKAVNPANPTLGQDVTFTITVTNNGPSAAAGVVVSDYLPAGVSWVSDDGAGAYVPGTGLWTVGALANGASAALHVVGKVGSTDQACNSAIITAGTPLDPNPANNQSTVCVSAPRSADLSLGMTVSSPTTQVGANVTFTLTVRNDGVDPAYALNVQESFPAFPSLDPGTYTASQGVYNPATGLWNLGSLGSGKTAALALTVTAPSMAGALTNQGTASSTTSDPDNANNTASATTTVLSPAAIAGATKTVSGLRFPGAVVTYTIVLPNTGTFDQIDNPGDEFTDVLPAELRLEGASATSGTAVADTATNTVHWNGSIPAGSSVTITIQARIASAAGGATISNQGTAYFDADGNGTNESTVVTDDPAVGGATDPTAFRADAQAAIPAASTAGLALLAFLTALGAVFVLRSRIG